VRTQGLNRQQRIVFVIGLGIGLYVFGGWATTRGGVGSGWVSYAPLSDAANRSDIGPGLHPWVRLVIWLALITIWVVVGVLLLRSRPTKDSLSPPIE
jgi:heme/copper-type cytochrome/quinol oxidase subunit 1